MIRYIEAFDKARTAKARRALLAYHAKHPMATVWLSVHEAEVLHDAIQDDRDDRDALGDDA